MEYALNIGQPQPSREIDSLAVWTRCPLPHIDDHSHALHRWQALKAASRSQIRHPVSFCDVAEVWAKSELLATIASFKLEHKNRSNSTTGSGATCSLRPGSSQRKETFSPFRETLCVGDDQLDSTPQIRLELYATDPDTDNIARLTRSLNDELNPSWILLT